MKLSVIRAAIMTLRQGGRAMLMGGIGMLGGNDRAFPCPWIMRNLITIQGQWLYDTVALPGLLNMIRNGMLDLGHRTVIGFPLDQANESVTHAANHMEPLKPTTCMLWHSVRGEASSCKNES